MMDEMKRKFIAEKIAQYRKAVGLSQLELAEKINYSDKSVSKWERGEGVPDVATMMLLAEIFGITVNDIVYDQPEDQPQEQIETVSKTAEYRDSTDSRYTWGHFFITLLAVAGVWLLAFLTIFLLGILVPEFGSAWDGRIVCYAAFGSFTAFFVFAYLWWPYIWRFICATGMVWMAALSIHITFPMRGAGMIYAVGGFVQLIVVLCYFWKCATLHRFIPLSLFPKGAMKQERNK